MKHFIYMICFFVMVAACGPAQAAPYSVDKEASTITFAGEHAGNAFSGVFESWEAEIAFDPDNLAASHVKAVFDLASATTGNKTYDGTLPQGDWFDVENHPQGVFESRSFVLNEDGSYSAEGVLTLRGVEQPLSFTFTLSDLSHSPVTVQAGFTIDRLAYGMGEKSDPEAEWVSREIQITLDLQAHAQGAE